MGPFVNVLLPELIQQIIDEIILESLGLTEQQQIPRVDRLLQLHFNDRLVLHFTLRNEEEVDWNPMERASIFEVVVIEEPLLLEERTISAIVLEELTFQELKSLFGDELVIFFVSANLFLAMKLAHIIVESELPLQVLLEILLFFIQKLIP